MSYLYLQKTGLFNVKDYGAIGNGNSNIASNHGYSTLNALKAKYPFATALTNELDWLAHQAAINAAKVTGGRVYTPKGTYILDQTIVFPESTIFDGVVGNPVDWVGEGYQFTVLKWPVDMGTGKFAVSFGDPTATYANSLGRYAPLGMYEGVMEDLSIEGPTHFSNLGQRVIQMSGVAWGSRRRVNRCVARYFNAAWDIVGDHCSLIDVQGVSSYYGLYFNEISASLFGDLIFEDCLFGTNFMASIGVHYNSQITAVMFNSCYLGSTPYGILREAGTPTHSGSDIFINQCQFNRCNIEFMGNACISDDNGLTGSKIGKIYNTSFRDCYISSNTDYKITNNGRSNFALFDVSDMTGVIMEGFDSSPIEPGTDAVFKLDSIGVVGGGGIRFEGNMDVILDACDTANIPFLHPSITNSSEQAFHIVFNGIWSGYCAMMQFSGALPQNPIRGDVIEHSFDTVTIGGYDMTTPIAGIAMCKAATRQVVVMATSGNSLNVNSGGFTLSNQLPVKKGLQIGSVTISNAGTGYVAGNTITLSGGTFTTAAIVTVNTVNAGAITSYTLTNTGNYSALPSGLSTQTATSGSGSGATFNTNGLYGKVVSANNLQDQAIGWCRNTGGISINKNGIIKLFPTL